MLNRFRITEIKLPVWLQTSIWISERGKRRDMIWERCENHYLPDVSYIHSSKICVLYRQGCKIDVFLVGITDARHVGENRGLHMVHAMSEEV